MGEVPPSNYYRPPMVGPPIAPGPGNVSVDAISVAWRIITSDLATFVVASVIVVAISIALNAILQPIQAEMMYGTPSLPRPLPGQLFPPDYWVRMWIALPLSMLSGSLQYCVNAGLIEIGIRKVEGTPTNVGDLFVPFRRFGQLFLAGLIVGVIVTVGTFLLCLPGLLALAVLAFTPIFVYRQNLNALDAIKMSYQTLQRDMWMMLAVLFLAGLASMVGVCACCIGIIFTMPIYSVTVALIYGGFFPPQPQWPSAPLPEAPRPQI